jgi:predicted nucleic acid-binding protein
VLRTERAASFVRLTQDPALSLHVPALCDVEFVSGLRRVLRNGEMDEPRAYEALSDYIDLPLERYPHEALLERVLELRQNFTAYDATYVALAERVGGDLITADLRLAAATRAFSDLSVTHMDARGA